MNKQREKDYKFMNKRKKYIDLIRAFAVYLVVLYHFSHYTEQLGFSLPIFLKYANGTWGNIGVFLFFMISGNVLMYKYQEQIDWKEFYKNRFKKILIPFWLCYFICFLLNFWQTKALPEIPIYKFLY